jgi:hypothetical protein
MRMAHCVQWNVPVSWSQWLTEREVQWSGTLQLGIFFLYLLRTSVVFPMHSPSTRSVSANSGNDQPLPMLYWYIMCFPKFMLVQADLHVIHINVYLSTTVLYVQSETVINIIIDFIIKRTSTIKQHRLWNGGFSECGSRSWHKRCLLLEGSSQAC